MSDRFHHLCVRPTDFDSSLAFYRDVLGWGVTENWGGNGKPRGAMLSGGGIKVLLAEEPEESKVSGSAHVGPTLHLDIHDIDRRFRTLPKGTHVVLEPQPTQWGTRWFVVRDPDGHLIAFEEVHGG